MNPQNTRYFKYLVHVWGLNLIVEFLVDLHRSAFGAVRHVRHDPVRKALPFLAGCIQNDADRFTPESKTR